MMHKNYESDVISISVDIFDFWSYFLLRPHIASVPCDYHSKLFSNLYSTLRNKRIVIQFELLLHSFDLRLIFHCFKFLLFVM